MSTAPAFQTADKLSEPCSVSDEIAKALRVRDEAILKLANPTEQTQDANPTFKQSGANIRPEEKQALIQLLSDLAEKNKELQATVEKQAKNIKDLTQEVSEATEAIIEIREHFPALIGSINKRLSKLEHPAKMPGLTSQDRAKKIDRYMEGRPDHKASYEALKGFLVINDVLLNFSIASLKNDYPDKYITIKDRKDHRKRWLLEVQKIL